MSKNGFCLWLGFACYTVTKFFQPNRNFDPSSGEMFDRPQPVSANLKVALPEEFLRKTSVTSNQGHDLTCLINQAQRPC
jgi:hypothetical protein